MGEPHVLSAEEMRVVIDKFRRYGRAAVGQRIFCMNMGIAIDDMVTAARVLTRAEAVGAGTLLPL